MRYAKAGTIATGIAVTGAAAFWLWRHQGDVFSRPPLSRWTFTHMDAVMPTETVSAAPTATRPWAVAPVDLSGFRYRHEGRERSLGDLHRRTGTTGFVVVNRGRIVHEEYPGTFAGPGRRFQLFSITKSVTSLLVGIACERGLVTLDTMVSDVLSSFTGTAYGETTVDELLQMSSGVGDVEDWTSPDALINRFETAVTGGGAVIDLVRAASRSDRAGQEFNYSTIDSHILGLVLEEVAGMPLARWAQQELWRPLGAEHDAYYFLTRGRPRHALAGGSFNATLRDIARVGQLVLDDGVVGAHRVVSESWIERCHRPLYPGHAVGELGVSGYPHYGYSTQWWLVGDRPAAITGLGVYGQYLWIDPASQTVIVRTATWPTPDDEVRDAETYAAFCALCAHLQTDADDE